MFYTNRYGWQAEDGSIFTIEQDTGDMPFFENKDFKESLLNIDITEDLVIKKIKIKK